MEAPPALSAVDVQRIKDAEHLRILSLGYYIIGGFTALFSSFGLIHLTLGLLIVTGVIPTDVPASRPQASHAIQEATASPADAMPDQPPPTPQELPSAGETRRPANAPMPRAFGYLFVGLGAAVVLLGWTVGGLTIYAGRCLRRHRRPVFTYIMAGVNCLQIPFGTALGICTFIVLPRPTVQALYHAPGTGRPSL